MNAWQLIDVILPQTTERSFIHTLHLCSVFSVLRRQTVSIAMIPHYSPIVEMILYRRFILWILFYRSIFSLACECSAFVKVKLRRIAKSESAKIAANNANYNNSMNWRWPSTSWALYWTSNASEQHQTLFNLPYLVDLSIFSPTKIVRLYITDELLLRNKYT